MSAGDAAMKKGQQTKIQIHLASGKKRWFATSDPTLVTKICDDSNGPLFTTSNLVIEGSGEILAFPGSGVVGITVLIDPLPASFSERERRSTTVLTQISHEDYLETRRRLPSRLEGRRSTMVSRVEFSNGEQLFLKFNEIAISGVSERTVLRGLFTEPSISCRRLDGGFTIWNSAHIVSWSHCPKLFAPSDSWRAEQFSGLRNERGRFMAMD